MAISASFSSFALRSVPLSPTASATATVFSVPFPSRTIRVDFPITGASSRTTRSRSQFVGPKNNSLIVGASGSENQIDENENESESDFERAVALFKSRLEANSRPTLGEFHVILMRLLKTKHYSQVLSLCELTRKSGVVDDFVTIVLHECYNGLGDYEAADAILEDFWVSKLTQPEILKKFELHLMQHGVTSSKSALELLTERLRRRKS